MQILDNSVPIGRTTLIKIPYHTPTLGLNDPFFAIVPVPRLLDACRFNFSEIENISRNPQNVTVTTVTLKEYLGSWQNVILFVIYYADETSLE